MKNKETNQFWQDSSKDQILRWTPGWITHSTDWSGQKSSVLWCPFRQITELRRHWRSNTSKWRPPPPNRANKKPIQIGW